MLGVDGVAFRLGFRRRHDAGANSATRPACRAWSTRCATRYDEATLRKLGTENWLRILETTWRA